MLADTNGRPDEPWQKKCMPHDLEMSRLPSSAGDSFEQQEKAQPKHPRVTSTDILTDGFADFAAELCEQNKNAHRTQHEAEKEIAQWLHDDRTRRFPTVVPKDEADVSDFVDTTAGAQEVSGTSTRRGTPGVSAHPSHATLPRQWQAPTAWNRTFKDESEKMTLSDVGGLAQLR